MNINQICPECGSPLVSKKYRHIESVGGIKVSDETALVPQCEKCGNVDLTLEQLAGYERRAAALVLQSVSPAKGSTVRYARKALGFTQLELAKLLDHCMEEISRWENNKVDIPRSEQLAIIALLDRVERTKIDSRALLDQAEELKKGETPETLEVQKPEAA